MRRTTDGIPNGLTNRVSGISSLYFSQVADVAHTSSRIRTSSVSSGIEHTIGSLVVNLRATYLRAREVRQDVCVVVRRDSSRETR